MSRVRRVHAAAQREGGRLCLLQGVPLGRDRRPMDSGARAGSDAPGGPATGWLTSTSATLIRLRTADFAVGLALAGRPKCNRWVALLPSPTRREVWWDAHDAGVEVLPDRSLARLQAADDADRLGGTVRGRSGALDKDAAGLQPPEVDVRASDATDSPVRRLENARCDRLRRTPVVFRVARLAWPSPVWLSVACAFFSVVALAALGASSSAAPAVCNGLTDHPPGIAGVPCSRSSMMAGS